MSRLRVNKGRGWKMERASVHRKGAGRARSNKFSGGDSARRPSAHSQKNTWVGGHVRKNGVRVKGYYRSNSGYIK